MTYGVCRTDNRHHPVTPHEQEESCTDWREIIPHPDQSLKARFRNVTLIAGYTGEAPDRIVARWYDWFMYDDQAKFVEMLEEYETGEWREKA